MKKAFGQFGFDLTDPETEVKLNIPKSFKVTHKYKLLKNVFTENLEGITDKILSQV